MRLAYLGRLLENASTMLLLAVAAGCVVYGAVESSGIIIGFGVVIALFGLGQAYFTGVFAANPERRCPECAESIKADARVCRFCGYRFEAG